MERTRLVSLARRVLRLPTAPYHEQHIAKFIREECARLGVPVKRDRFGNLIARHRHGMRLARPLAFVAHMDHPGFEVIENSRDGTVRAEFLGGILKECLPGAPVRLFGSKEVVARVIDIETWESANTATRKQIVRLKLNGTAKRGDFGMWDFPPVIIRGDRLRSRGCDDVVGCIALLAAMNDLVADRARSDAFFVFTRAEEVGFQGALAMARAGTLPRTVRVVSVETSKEILPRAKMGAGPIVRVGDRAAVFDSTTTRFLAAVGEELHGRDKRFLHQRCLMDGGICEATAFGEHGYQAGGLCIALGNYHNIGPRGRAAAEYVSVSDLHNLVKLIAASARLSSKYNALTQRLRDRLDDLHRVAMRRLTPSFNLLD